MSAIYKTMCKEHIKAVAQIERECFSCPWSENAFHDELDNAMSLTLVALWTNEGSKSFQEKENVAGFVNVRIVKDEVYINNLAVSKEFRLKGIGKGLLSALEDAARNKKASFITLEVRESNLPAISLYKSVGYKKAGMRKGFYREPYENAVLMTKYLV